MLSRKGSPTRVLSTTTKTRWAAPTTSRCLSSTRTMRAPSSISTTSRLCVTSTTCATSEDCHRLQVLPQEKGQSHSLHTHLHNFLTDTGVQIRCSGYEQSQEGRCQNCVRFNQQCLFHPVSSQGAFVPASAVYGPGAHGPPFNGRDNRDAPVLYGACGQPLGPVPRDGPLGNYGPPPPGYAPQTYQNGFGLSPQGGAPFQEYDYRGQGPSPLPEQIMGQKRSLPDDDPHDKAHFSQSPHPNSRPRTIDSHNNNDSTYPDPPNMTLISLTNSVIGDQTNPPAGYYNSAEDDRSKSRSQPPQSNNANGKTSPSAHRTMSVKGMLDQSTQNWATSELTKSSQ